MNDVRGLLAQALSLARQGRLAEAAPHCRRILEIDADRPEAHLLLGLAEVQQGKHADAVRHLERYLQVQPADPQARYNLGLAYQQLGHAEPAMEAYRRALERAPTLIAARVNLSVLLRAAGQGDEALAVLDAAPPASAQPEQGHLHAERARVLEALGRAPEAVEQWQRAIAAAPAAPGIAVPAAAAIHRHGNSAEAEDLLRSVLEAQPQNAPAWNALAVVLAATSRPADAIEAARRAIELAPGNAGYQYNLAALLSKRTRREDLLASQVAARACLDLESQHAEAHYCLGLVQAKLEQGEAAVASLRRAVDLAPDRPEFPVALADQLAVTGDVEGAVTVLEDAARSHPQAADVHRQLGVHRLKLQAAEPALASLDQALQIAPRDQRSIAHRAVALQQLGRHDDAERWLGFDRHVHQRMVTPPPGFDDLDRFNRALGADIRNHSLLRWEPMGLAARNGALTEELLADRTPAILGFEARLREAIEAIRTGAATEPDDPFLRAIPGPGYELNIWATLVEGGGNIDTHIHEESWLSGAYYVELPETMGVDERDPAGWIEFGRPHRVIPLPEGARLKLVRPREGLLILFPSYLFHRTIPHVGSGQRISISFDLVPRALEA